MSKIHCLFHEDSTPSLELYSNGYFCFGCGANGTIEELEKKTTHKVSFGSPYYRKHKEDLEDTKKYIQSLPSKVERGFPFHYDAKGFYIEYPGSLYYVKRMWTDATKYRSPLGISKPLFHAKRTLNTDILFVVEGQLNAITAAQHIGAISVISPGSAGDLNKPKFVEYYLQYNKICIIVDKDPAGIVSGLQLRETLIANKKQVVLHAMEKDLNEILVTDGEDATKKELTKLLELFGV